MRFRRDPEPYRFQRRLLGDDFTFRFARAPATEYTASGTHRSEHAQKPWFEASHPLQLAVLGLSEFDPCF